MRILGIIPARGGSQGIPNKNIYPINGRPLIDYTIKEAQKSARLTRCVVSTDSPTIKTIAEECGADVPFMRPAEYATHTAKAHAVLRHAILTIEEMEGARYDAACMLQPTTPLRRADDIDGAIEKFIRTGADSVISVIRLEDKHPIRIKKIEDDQLHPFCLPEPELMPRQHLKPDAYLRNGAVYVFKRDNLIEHGTIFGDVSRPYIMAETQSVNIDTMMDLKLAEYLLNSDAPC